MRIDPDYEAACHRELICWIGASVTFQMGKVHPQAVLAFEGRTRKVFFPGSPSDSRRGRANFLKDIRRELRNLGAQRSVGLPCEPRSAVHKHKPKQERSIKPPTRKQEESKPDNWPGPLQALHEQMTTKN